MDSVEVQACGDQIDRYVADLLDGLAMTRPPFEPRVAARRLGFEVLFDASQSGRGRHVRVGGRTVLVVRPEVRPERTAWTLAHELGEALMPELATRLPHSADAFSAPRLREALASQFAVRFLLPKHPFQSALSDFDRELPLLKQRFHNASHELLALRCLDFVPSAVVTVFDQGRLTRRVGAEGQTPSRLDHRERDCWSRVRDNRQSQRFQSDGWTVQGWAVDEPGWQREILLTEPPDC